MNMCVCVVQVSRINRSSAGRREGRVLLMVVSMVSCYLLCWMPYGVVALLASFGRPGMVPPAASLIPSLLAKTSTVLNPVVYVLLNNQVTTTTHPQSTRGGVPELACSFQQLRRFSGSSRISCEVKLSHNDSAASICVSLSSPGVSCT